MTWHIHCVALLWLLVAEPIEAAQQANTLRLASWNVENYLIQNRVVEGRWLPDYPKPEAQKAALRRVLRKLRPDVLALQEMGSEAFLNELQSDLKAEGLHYPYRATGSAADSVRHIAFLSKYPFNEVTIHSDPDFPYFGERLKTRRGLLEISIYFNDHLLSLFTLHLKSNWTNREDDPQSQQRRTSEAFALRNRILQQIEPESDLYVILGDFNDHRESSPLRRFLQIGGRSISHIVDAEDSRGERWTQHWQRQDLYSRLDFILVSPTLLPYTVEQSAIVADSPDVTAASDHRLIYLDLKLPDGSAD